MIEISHLTKLYGDFVAVDDVSLVAKPGEVFGFLGPNGAGKTTTIRIVAGLSVPTSGVVKVNGVDVVAEPREAKSNVGYVPDRPFLYEKLSGWELLRFVCDLYRRDWKECRPRAARLLDYLGLDGWAGARIENYSNGMKQKLVLVSALVYDPRTLVIDEPMVGLDALAQKQVKTLLRELVAEGKAIFLTTHTMSVAEAVCDRIAIIDRGKIVAHGTPDELKRMAAQPESDLEDVFLEITTASTELQG
ncbi:MAG: ABC transporter ATP-binding protein [Acidobacteria bacterium]|nr:ABC transporter ATP-binding protein [Acidobacteriota bacterium]